MKHTKKVKTNIYLKQEQYDKLNELSDESGQPTACLIRYGAQLVIEKLSKPGALEKFKSKFGRL